jgi:hypothetical protein
VSQEKVRMEIRGLLFGSPGGTTLGMDTEILAIVFQNWIRIALLDMKGCKSMQRQQQPRRGA